MNSVPALLPCTLRKVALLLPLLGLPGLAAAQAATVSVERENFRALARGTVIAELVQGAPLTLGEAREGWREATLEAWIWGASVREEPREGHDLIVAPANGENLRAEPNGRRIGRARPGMFLDRVETRGDWVRVRRTGWIWEASIEVGAAGEAGAARPEARTAPAEPAARPAEPRARPATAGTPRAAPEAEYVETGARGVVVLDAPAGDTLARVHPGGSVQVLAREGDWTRVRVEGWTPTGALTASDSATGPVLRDISLEELQADSEGVRGRLVEWTVQFIALQHAERFRNDFLEGEPFLLARGPGSEAGFVYIAVPSDREAELARLTPLERYRVVGRVRTARSRLTDAPVIDLLEIRPAVR